MCSQSFTHCIQQTAQRISPDCSYLTLNVPHNWCAAVFNRFSSHTTFICRMYKSKTKLIEWPRTPLSLQKICKLRTSNPSPNAARLAMEWINMIWLLRASVFCSSFYKSGESHPVSSSRMLTWPKLESWWAYHRFCVRRYEYWLDSVAVPSIQLYTSLIDISCIYPIVPLWLMSKFNYNFLPIL